MINRRNFIRNASLSALSLALLEAGKTQAFAQQREFDETVRIGYLPITDATALLIAHAEGFFQQQGLESARPTLIRSWSTLVEAFVTGKFNLVHLLKPIPIWMRFNKNIPVKIVAWAHTNGSAIVVGKHTNIRKIEQLAGANIAVPYWYSIHNIILQKMLRAAGLEPVIKSRSDKLANNEVNLQILPPPEMPLALLAKKIDGYIVAEPFNALGELKAKAHLLRFTGDVWKNHPCCVVTMHEKHLNEQQEWSQKVVNALVAAEKFASENRLETAKILSKQGKSMLPFDEKIIQRAMNYYDVPQYRDTGAVQNIDEFQNNRIDFQPYPYHSATKYIIEAMRETLVEGDKKFLDAINSNEAAREIVDARYVKKSLGIVDEYQRQEKIIL